MGHYEINMAKKYQDKDWQGIPSHRFFARIELDSSLTENEALSELEKLDVIYPFPEFHLTLRHVQVVQTGKHLYSNATPEFLDARQWTYESTKEPVS